MTANQVQQNENKLDIASNKAPFSVPPAIIIGSGITALGTLRALAVKGVRTYCVSSNPDFEKYSRWYRSIRPENGGSQDLTTLLSSLPVRNGIVFLCSDHLSRAYSLLPPNLKERFRAVQSPLTTLELLQSKSAFARKVLELAIPAPRSFLNPTPELFASLPLEELQNFFLKPVDSQSFFARFGRKAFDIQSYTDAHQKLHACKDAGEDVLMQEYIPGPATHHIYVEGYVDSTGTIRSTFARRRLRMHPNDFGNSTAMVSIACSEVEGAVKSVHKLLRSIYYVGIYSAECKLDSRDNVYKIIEVNSRPWWYINCPTACGVNIAYQAYCDAARLEVASITNYKVGVRIINGYTDFVVLSARFAKRRASICGWIKEWVFCNFTVSSIRDPLPGLVWLGSRVITRLKKLFT